MSHLQIDYPDDTDLSPPNLVIVNPEASHGYGAEQHLIPYVQVTRHRQVCMHAGQDNGCAVLTSGKPHDQSCMHGVMGSACAASRTLCGRWMRDSACCSCSCPRACWRWGSRRPRLHGWSPASL